MGLPLTSSGVSFSMASANLGLAFHLLPSPALPPLVWASRVCHLQVPHTLGF